MRRLLALGLFVAVFVALLPAIASGQDGSWRITAWASDITILEDGDVEFLETLHVDFGTLERHGIYRDLVVRQSCGEVTSGPEPLYECPSGSDRVYPFTLVGVTDEAGNALQVQVSDEGALKRIRIGDPDVTISGRVTYVIAYRLQGALNAFAADDGFSFAAHDEFFWNVTGNGWEATIESAAVTVRLPDATAGNAFAACYEGRYSTSECDISGGGAVLQYTATRPLYPGEELTIVAGWPSGIVDVQPPFLDDRPSIDDYFELDWIEWAGVALAAIAGIALLLRAWWLWGRDRRYRTIFYLTEDAEEHTAPLFGHFPIVVEYLPPDDLRPAQMGVIVDERADTLDVTATIIDLAVRGYLTIEEHEKTGWFGKTDWELHKVEPAPDEELLPYEKKLYSSLFRNRTSVKVSKLKTKFHKQLSEVKDKLYDDAMEHKWFPRNPETMRNLWTFIGIAWAVAGVALSIGAALLIGRGLIGVPIVVTGLLMMVVSRGMARRTAHGSETMRRVLGFKRYIVTAETRRAEFEESVNLFTRYLPFAIVFECVDKWAEAFEGLEDQLSESTAYWYHGVAPFHIGAFSSGLGDFSSSVSSAISSTPGGSGGSGFSGGGFSGGGGGGGGGGSW